MIEILLSVERKAAKHGWDMPPALLLANVNDNGSGIVVAAAPMQPTDFDDDVPAGMDAVAKLLENSEMPAMDPLVADSFAAVILVTEAWQVTSEQMEAFPDLHGADNPGAMETRRVDAVDCGGRYYSVTRTRGEEPEVLVLRGGRGESEQVSGAMIRSLIRIVKAVARWSPPDSKDLMALNALLREVREL